MRPSGDHGQGLSLKVRAFWCRDVNKHRSRKLSISKIDGMRLLMNSVSLKKYTDKTINES